MGHTLVEWVAILVVSVCVCIPWLGYMVLAYHQGLGMSVEVRHIIRG